MSHTALLPGQKRSILHPVPKNPYGILGYHTRDNEPFPPDEVAEMVESMKDIHEMDRLATPIKVAKIGGESGEE